MSHSHSVRTVKQAYQPNLGKSSEQQVLMVKITWTSAKIVPVTFKKRTEITASVVSISDKDKSFQVLKTKKIPVLAGSKIFFTRSENENNTDGWYYITKSVTQDAEDVENFSCTCKGGRQHSKKDFKHHCKHINKAVEKIEAKKAPKVGKLQQMIDAAKEQSRQLSKKKPFVAEEISDAEVDQVLAEIEELDKAS